MWFHIDELTCFENVTWLVMSVTGQYHCCGVRCRVGLYWLSVTVNQSDRFLSLCTCMKLCSLLATISESSQPCSVRFSSSHSPLMPSNGTRTSMARPGWAVARCSASSCITKQRRHYGDWSFLCCIIQPAFKNILTSTFLYCKNDLFFIYRNKCPPRYYARDFYLYADFTVETLNNVFL